MRRLIKFMLLVVTMVALVGTTKVYAEQIGSFTFTFININTYRYRISMAENKLFGKGYAGVLHYADGEWYEDEYLKLKKGAFKVNVGTEDNLAAPCAEISGKGILTDSRE